MCTCITLKEREFYFGRNLDLNDTFGNTIVVTPGSFPLCFAREGKIEQHFSMIGMAEVRNGYPLYGEAANEKGVAMAGLYFPGHACYQREEESRRNYQVAPFELILWILGQCGSVEEAMELLEKTVITDRAFSSELPNVPLHWMLADQERCVTVEAVKEGVRIYENPFGVLTNNPPFPFYNYYVSQYLHLTKDSPESTFSETLKLRPFGEGMGAVGLPGDLSPASRFVRASFLKENAVGGTDEMSCVTRFFHILEQTGMVEGTVRTGDGGMDRTTYSCCMNATQGIYYCRTYENNRIQAVKLKKEDAGKRELLSYPVVREQDVSWLRQ